jgi:hypothetical protein
MRDPTPLIDSLSARLEPVARYRSTRTALRMWLIGWLATLALVLGVGTMRPGAGAQLAHSPQLALEMLIGVAAGIALTLAAVSFAVPGSRKRFVGLGALALVAWIALLLIGLVVPAVPPSLVGQRSACYLQVILFALPMLAIGIRVLRSGYVVNGALGGAVLGLASGALPALAMQFACLYEPLHGLVFHLGPVLLTGALGALLGYFALPRHTRA